MRKTITAKKKRGGRKLLLFFLFLLAFGIGWYLKDENRRQEAIVASQDIPGLVDKVGKEFPGWIDKAGTELPILWDKTVNAVTNFDFNSIKSLGSNIPLTLFRLYDAYTPIDWRMTLAEGMPDFFAFPYLCRMNRIFLPSTGQEVTDVPIPADIGQERVGLRVGSTLYPGTLLRGPKRFSYEVKCRGELITVSPGTTLQLLRGEGTAKVLRVDGVANVRAENGRNVGFSFSWGEVTLVPRGLGSFQLGSSPKTSQLSVYDGDINMLWLVQSVVPSGGTRMKVAAGPNAKIRVTRRYGSDEEPRIISPTKTLYFLASGRFSDRPVAATVIPTMAQPIGGSGGGESLEVVDKLMVAKTPWFAAAKTVDMTIRWRLAPQNRTLPCKVDLSVDPSFGSVLATYQSTKMSLFLKGVQPAIYYWRARCESGGRELTSNAGKIQVVDGRSSPPVPVLLQPGEGQKTKSPIEFRWKPIEGAKSYILQLSRFRDFRSGKPYTAKGPGLNMNLKKRATYYWRVFGVGEGNRYKTATSPVRSFKF